MKLNIDVENFKSVQDVMKSMESAPEPVIEDVYKRQATQKRLSDYGK